MALKNRYVLTKQKVRSESKETEAARMELLKEKARAELLAEKQARADLLAREKARAAPLAREKARAERQGEEEAQRAKAKAELELRQSAQELAEIFGLVPGGPAAGVQLSLPSISSILSEPQIDRESRRKGKLVGVVLLHSLPRTDLDGK